MFLRTFSGQDAGAYNGHTQRATASGATHAHYQHSQLLPEKLDTIGSEWLVTGSAILLLKVFLDGPKGPALESTHY